MENPRAIRAQLRRRGAEWWVYVVQAGCIVHEATGEIMDETLTPNERRVWFASMFREAGAEAHAARMDAAPRTIPAMYGGER